VALIGVLSSPQPLSSEHETESFDSGQLVLDNWLRRRALSNQSTGASRTFVVCEETRVVAFYALASGAITQAGVTGNFRRNMPEPIPVVVLARLAVDRAYQGRGLGRGMFRDAAQRVVRAADSIGIRGIIVHAISDEARRFYIALGFDPSPTGPMTLLVTLKDLSRSLDPAKR
jgi:GNAT superfamily N-acetyltransferase